MNVASNGRLSSGLGGRTHEYNEKKNTTNNIIKNTTINMTWSLHTGPGLIGPHIIETSLFDNIDLIQYFSWQFSWHGKFLPTTNLPNSNASFLAINTYSLVHTWISGRVLSCCVVLVMSTFRAQNSNLSSQAKKKIKKTLMVASRITKSSS